MPEAVTSGTQDRELGQRLKQLRRGRQLSQDELGGSRFSGSYVSHVESGRRRLNREMIQYFADRLGVSAEQITSPETAVAPVVDDADRVVAFQEVQRAFAQHQFPRAARAADEALRRAELRGDVADAWSLALMRAQALFEAGEYQQAATAAAELVDQPLARFLPHLPVEALLIAARGARAASDLPAALARAEQAAEMVNLVDSTDLQAETHAVYIGALMESDLPERAAEVAVQLVELMDRIQSDHIRGLAEWVVGNVSFLTGSVEEGLRRHAAAQVLLRPEVDLRIWGRFRQASASVRLRNQMTDGVLQLLNQAGDALRIVGNPSDLSELRLAEGRLWLLEHDLPRARALAVHSLGDESLAKAPLSRADAEVLLGDIEVADRRLREAAQAYQRAALDYERAGAYRRSVQMWRQHAGLVGPSTDTGRDG